jgi:hypothetical protein
MLISTNRPADRKKMNMPTESKYTSPSARKVFTTLGSHASSSAIATGTSIPSRRFERSRHAPDRNGAPLYSNTGVTMTMPATRMSCAMAASMSVTPYSAPRYIIACIMPNDASPKRLSARRRSRWYSTAAALPARGTGLNPARSTAPRICGSAVAPPPRQSTHTRPVALLTRTDSMSGNARTAPSMLRTQPAQ